MKILCVAALLLFCSMVGRPPDVVFNVPGILKLVDRPPDSTPVEALHFRFHPLGSGFDIEAQPDRDGRFTMPKVRPGRYSLIFPMPGRIESFTNQSIELAPDAFELRSGSVGPLVLVISMKTVQVFVNIQGLPTGRNDAVALLAPADPRLTLRESCYMNTVSASQTTFRFMPPGKYRIFVFDHRFQQDVAAYAPRFLDFLKGKATSVEVRGIGRTEATATYLDPRIVERAIRQASLSQ